MPPRGPIPRRHGRWIIAEPLTGEEITKTGCPASSHQDIHEISPLGYVYIYVYVYVCTCVKQRSGSGCWCSRQKFDTIVVWWVCRCRQDFSLLRWSVVQRKTRVLATGRTTRGLFHSPSVFRHSLSLVEHEECLPSSSCHWGTPGRWKTYPYVIIDDHAGKAGPWSARCWTKGTRSRRRSRRWRRRDEHESKEVERGRSSEEERREIRAGTEKGEKKVKVQRGRKQPVQVQVFYYARLSRLWHSCFEEPGNLGWTEWGVSGYPTSLRSLPFSLLLRHGFVASEHPLILFCRVKLRN